jgi:hypothetical protein
MPMHPFDSLFAFFKTALITWKNTFSNGLAQSGMGPSILMAFAQLSRDMQQEEEHRFGLKNYTVKKG